MATTTPDEIWTPDSGDDYALTTDLAAMADTVQDALNGIHADVTALETLTDGIEDTGWIVVTSLAGTGFTPTQVRYRKKDGVVYVVFAANFTSGSWTAGWSLFTFPAGFRPVAALPVPSFYGGTLKECSLSTTGTLTILQSGSGGVALAFSFIADN